MQSQFESGAFASTSKKTSHLPLAHRKQSLIASAITMLSDQEIKLMNREDVLNVLRMAQAQCPLSDEKNFANMDVTELRCTLAFVREYFRKQMNRQTTPRNWSPEFN